MEGSVSSRFAKKAKNLNCSAIKQNGPKGFPDRLVLTPKGKAFFIEFKIGENTPSRHQEYWRTVLKNNGFDVYVCYSVKEGIESLKKELCDNENSCILF